MSRMINCEKDLDDAIFQSGADNLVAYKTAVSRVKDKYRLSKLRGWDYEDYSGEISSLAFWIEDNPNKTNVPNFAPEGLERFVDDFVEGTTASSCTSRMFAKRIPSELSDFAGRLCHQISLELDGYIVGKSYDSITAEKTS